VGIAQQFVRAAQLIRAVRGPSYTAITVIAARFRRSRIARRTVLYDGSAIRSGRRPANNSAGAAAYDCADWAAHNRARHGAADCSGRSAIAVSKSNLA
jgi:hypothetical protein